MGKFALIQAFYCIVGVLFFVRDLYARVDMGKAMVNAFIWPYAQWQVLHDAALRFAQPVLQMLN